MALKIPGCSDRIKGLVAKAVAATALKSQRKWAIGRGLDPVKLNSWVSPERDEDAPQPDLDGLKELQEAFGIPWEWILLGDDGAKRLIEHYRKHPPSTSSPPDRPRVVRPKPRQGGANAAPVPEEDE